MKYKLSSWHLNAMISLFLMLITSSVMATQLDRVIYDSTTKTVTTSDGEAIVSADFALDMYDIEDMRANEEDYENYFKSLAVDGVNAIRIAPWIGYWETIDNQSHWYNRHLADLQYLVDTTKLWAEEAGVYAILSYAGANSKQRAYDFWEIFAPQLKDDTHLVFETITGQSKDFNYRDLNNLDTFILSLAPESYRILASAIQRGGQPTTYVAFKYGLVDFSDPVDTATAVQELANQVPVIDYAVKSDFSGTSNRWDSVQGMQLETPITFADLSSISIDVKATHAQSFWVYLRDENNVDIAAYYDTTADTTWNTVSLNKANFGLAGGANENMQIASVQFFIGRDSSDAHTDNTFLFDNLVVSGTSGEVQGDRGAVDEQGTGWNVGYGKTTTIIDKNAPEPVDNTDYVVKSNQQVAGTPANRWDSVIGMALETPVALADLETVSFSVKATTAQSYWVYLRDENNADLASYYNTWATDGWTAETLNNADFGSQVAGNVASVQFFIGYDANSDTNSDNNFYFDDLVVQSTLGEVQGDRGDVDAQGTGWTLGYGTDTSIITQEEADTPLADSWAIRSELPGVMGNRWDSVTGMVLEGAAHISELTTVSFDVKADNGQSFWVYLRDVDGNDIGAHYNGWAGTDWETVTLQPGDFNDSSVADIASVQFFIGSTTDDSSASNAFYFDNVKVLSTSGEVQGERGKTDSSGTGWFELGYGHTNTVVYREPEVVVSPPPTAVAYDIEYQRSGGVDYFVSPDGDDNNDGLSTSTPFQDPQHAADIVGPGDRILLMAGEYTSGHYSSVIDIKAVGTADNWISIEPETEGTVTFNVNGNIGVVVNGGAYVRVKGLIMKGIADTLTPEEAEALRLENWYSVGLVGNGIGTESFQLPSGDYALPHHLIFEDNTISWMSGGCIGTKRADYIVIRNNEVHHCGLYNVWAQSGISVWENHNYDDNTATYRTVITGNRSYDNYNHFKFYASSDPDTADSYTDGNGIIIDALAIDQGYLSDGVGGIYSGRTLIENNLTYNNGGKGINIFASDNVDVIHNVSYQNGQHPEIPGEIALGNTANVRMLNNIIYAADDQPVFFAYQTQNMLIDNNIIYKDVAFDADDKMSLTVNTLNANPLLSGPYSADFTLLSGSPAIDAAIEGLTTEKDFNGNARPQGAAADIGAYEY